MKDKVLVTGADGFIGSHLVEALVKEGYQVKALTLYNSFNRWGWLDTVSEDIMKDVEVVSGDIRDAHGVMTYVKGCDAVLHLAALIAIPYSYYSPGSYVDTNVTGTLNVLQAARAFECRVLHTSTSEVYGSALYVPIDEEHPLQGQSPYSASKIGADQMALSFYSSFQLPVTVIRPFNTYGPRQSARAVIPSIIIQLASGIETIKLGSLFPTRDFSFVTDTVKGFLKGLEASNVEGKVINLGTGYEITIGNLVEMIADLMDKPLQLQNDPQRERPEKSEVHRLLSKNEKARELLQWQPDFGGEEGLRKGLLETIQWFSEEKNLSQYKSTIYNV